MPDLAKPAEFADFESVEMGWNIENEMRYDHLKFVAEELCYIKAE